MTTVSGSQQSSVFRGVLHVPDLGTNLLSIGASTARGVKVTFVETQVLFSRDGRTEMVGNRVDQKLYHLDVIACPPSSPSSQHATPPSTQACAASARPSIEIWHQRLAHVSYGTILEMAEEQLVDGLLLPANSVRPSSPCDGCAYGKMTRLPFPVGRVRATKIGQLIHSDVCGPMQADTPAGARFYVIFKDDFSQWRVVFFIKNKSEVFRLFITFVARLQSETKCRVTTLRSDNGGEYTSGEFEDWLADNGIKHETSAPHTPEQNGVAERDNRTIMEGARSLLHAKDLPLELWAEAVGCTVYILNRALTSTSPVTPYEAWYGKRPDLSNLRIFGSKCFVHIPGTNRQKLDAKSDRCIFVGYPDGQKAYRVWDPSTRRVKISRDVIFDEQPLAVAVKPSTSHPPLDHFGSREIAVPLPLPEESIAAKPPALAPLADVPVRPQSPVVQSRRYPSRAREPGWKSSDYVWLSSAENMDDTYEPQSYREAMKSPAFKFWLEAIREEYKSLLQNKTWTITPLPPGCKVIQSRWVFKLKAGSSISAPRYKARLVAKGFTQRPGIDYGETYAPVVKHDSLRVVLALAAVHDLELLQLDIKTAFLYGNLEEELYLEQPEGFAIAGREREVCRLKKCIYGLKQASRVWNQHFDDFLQRFGLQRSSTDSCIYFRRNEKEFTIICIWVDDGLLASSSKDALIDILSYLSDHFDIRSAQVDTFVGLQIKRDRQQRKLYVSQPVYTENILRRFNMADCNPRNVPADPNVHLTFGKSSSGEPVPTVKDTVPYREAVGSLMFLMVSSRPDIAYAVSQVSRFCERPEAPHWNAVKRILAYLRGTTQHGLCFSGSSITQLFGYTDSDFAGNAVDRRSTSGFAFLFNGSIVAWSSRRQSCVALSTTEAEYVAAAEATKEAIWLRRLLNETTGT